MCTYICRFVIPMRKISYTVPPALDGSSVAAVLRSHGFSTALLRSLKKTYGALSRNGCPVRTVDPVHTGDTVTVELNTGDATAPPSAEKAVIVYADRDILVVNKRAGMAMYETYNHHGNALSNAVAAAGFDGPFRPIYRLDKDTSGLVVLARHQLSAAKLAGRVQKDYYAVVPGTYTGSGTVDAPIAHCPDNTVKRQVDPAGVRAVTHWEALGQQGGRTLLRVQLETGRTHQIRVHFAHLGTPLVGDSLYGTAPIGARHLLHCKTIRLMHPVREEPVAFDCPFPSDMEEWNQCLPTVPTTSLPASCCPP